jgi:hypothetical protein
MPGTSTRTTFVGVRIPNDLLARLPDTGRSAAIVDAIRAKYETEIETASEPTARPRRTPKPKPEPELESDSPACPKGHTSGWPKAGGWWCIDCHAVY